MSEGEVVGAAGTTGAVGGSVGCELAIGGGSSVGVRVFGIFDAGTAASGTTGVAGCWPATFTGSTACALSSPRASDTTPPNKFALKPMANKALAYRPLRHTPPLRIGRKETFDRSAQVR